MEGAGERVGEGVETWDRLLKPMGLRGKKNINLIRHKIIHLQVHTRPRIVRHIIHALS